MNASRVHASAPVAQQQQPSPGFQCLQEYRWSGGHQGYAGHWRNNPRWHYGYDDGADDGPSDWDYGRQPARVLPGTPESVPLDPSINMAASSHRHSGGMCTPTRMPPPTAVRPNHRSSHLSPLPMTPQQQKKPEDDTAGSSSNNSTAYLSPSRLTESLPADASWGDIQEEEEELELQERLAGQQNFQQQQQQQSYQQQPASAPPPPPSPSPESGPGWSKIHHQHHHTASPSASGTAITFNGAGAGEVADKVAELRYKMAMKKQQQQQQQQAAGEACMSEPLPVLIQSYRDAVRKARPCEAPVDTLAMDTANYYKTKIVKLPGELTLAPATFDNLVDCDVVLADVTESVVITRCRNTSFFIAPARNGIYVDECEGCSFTAVAPAVSVTNSASLSFSLWVTSPTVVRNSVSLAFSPFAGSCPLLKELAEFCSMPVSAPNAWCDISSEDTAEELEAAPAHARFTFSKKANCQTISLPGFAFPQMVTDVFRQSSLD